jgi:hypothetical protein
MFGEYPKEEVVEMEQDGRRSDSIWLETTHCSWHPPADD